MDVKSAAKKFSSWIIFTISENFLMRYCMTLYLKGYQKCKKSKLKGLLLSRKSRGFTLLIWTKNFYQRIPPGTLKVVWILLNPTEFAQKIDLLINVPDVAPSTVEKMRSLQMCRIKKITLPSEQTFWDSQLCFYVKKLFVSEKPRKSELCHFS